MTGLKFVVGLAVILSSQASGGSPRAVADELLAADRAFSAASSKTDIVSGLSAMFSTEIVLTHAGGIAFGKDQAVEALKASPLNANGRLEWIPARASVSGDGRHGFTAGFMTLHRTDGAGTPLKYLAYWQKQPNGWRVLAYKRAIAKAPAPPTAVTYVLPEHLVPPITDAAAIESHRQSLAEAERSFSRDAQRLGLREAFTRYGDAEAINLGGPDVPTWLLGNEAIGAGIGGGQAESGSPVSWGPEKTIIAASGDFGVTIGYIVQNKPGADGKIPPALPFFTIWKRASTGGKWLYIAE